MCISALFLQRLTEVALSYCVSLANIPPEILSRCQEFFPHRHRLVAKGRTEAVFVPCGKRVMEWYLAELIFQ